MKKYRVFGMLASAVLLVGMMAVLFGGAPVVAQDGPAVIPDLELTKYVCPSDIGESGTAVPVGCADANAPDGADVPVIPVDGELSFLYQVTYPACPPAVICDPVNPISVTIFDNQLPTTTPTVFGPLVDANSDGQINPGDVWLYKISGLTAINLSRPDLTLPGGNPVPGCANAPDGDGTRPTYVNVAQVTGPSSSNEDPAAYCNERVPPTATLTSVCANDLWTWTVTATQSGAYVAQFLIGSTVVASINLNLVANAPQSFNYTGDPSTLTSVRVTFDGETVATNNGPFLSCALPPLPTATLTGVCANDLWTWTVTATQSGAYVAQFIRGTFLVASTNLNLTANVAQSFTFSGDPSTLTAVSITFNGQTLATNEGPFGRCTPPPTVTPTPVPIPEPVTVVLFGTGLAALSAALAARKRRSQ